MRVGHWTLPFKELPQTKLFKYQAEFMFGMNYKSDNTRVSIFHQGISFNLALTSKIASKKDN